MVRTRRSSTAVGLLAVLGRFTSMPRYIMGAVSMKMSKSTRTTSTSGMTLISARALRVRPAPSPPASVLIAILERLRRADQPALDQVRQLEREVVHLRGPVADLADEVVVADDGGDGREQTGRGRHQRLRDARRHHGQAGGALSPDGLEGRDDADHRAEQTDEGSGACRCSEEGQMLLHPL